jgi:hypothetical protein
MKKPEIPASGREAVPVICYPLHGCEAASPMTEEEQEAMRTKLLRAIRKHWGNAGVEAIVQMLEMECAIAQSRACLAGATPHDGGQAYGLQQLLGKIQRLKWQVVDPE